MFVSCGSAMSDKRKWGAWNWVNGSLPRMRSFLFLFIADRGPRGPSTEDLVSELRRKYVLGIQPSFRTYEWLWRNGKVVNVTESLSSKTVHADVLILVNICRHSDALHDDVIKWKHFPRYWPFVGHRWIPSTKASDAKLGVFFDLRQNKGLSKQWWGWRFETPSRPLCRYCNGTIDPQRLGVLVYAE